MELRRTPVVLSATVLLTLAAPAAAEPRIISLPDVAGAALYEGTLTMGGKNYRVRTSSRWIACPEDCEVDLEVLSEDGTVLGAARSDANQTPPPAVTAEPPPSKTEEPVAETPPPPPTAAEPVETPPPSEAAEAPPPPEPKHESDPETAEADPVPSRGTPSLVALSVGLGKETVTSKGGISDYKGSAGIGGTIVSAVVRPDGALGVDLEVGAHNYATKTKEEDIGSGSTRTRDSKFLRLGARATGFYDFLEGADGGATLGLGAGLRYMTMPTLQLTDASSGTADLKSESTIGPALTVYGATAADAAHQFAAIVESMPLSFGKAWRATHTGVSISWRYAFVPHLATVVDATYAADRMTGKVVCPAVARCTAESATKAGILQARLGLGYRF